MPVAKNPRAREFYVYRLEYDKVPFYVGIGRDKRAEDRVRFIESLIAREARGVLVNWRLSDAVVAYFLRRDLKIAVRYRFEDLARSTALTSERQEIARLVSNGAVLANYQNNARRPGSVEEVVRNVRERIRKRGRSIVVRPVTPPRPE
jgi:hypothetical protein